MFFRLFMALVVIVSGYVVFEMVRVHSLHTALLETQDAYVLGNPQGDVTFVAFLDYRCPYCRAAHPEISDALARDSNVRFIPRPVDILVPGGIGLAALPYAASKQGKFEEMHDALMNNEREITPQLVQDLALQVGIDPMQLQEDLESPEIQALNQENSRLFFAFRTNVTPTYFVGRDIMFSPYERPPTSEDFLAIFAEGRQNQ